MVDTNVLVQFEGMTEPSLEWLDERPVKVWTCVCVDEFDMGFVKTLKGFHKTNIWGVQESCLKDIDIHVFIHTLTHTKEESTLEFVIKKGRDFSKPFQNW